MKMHYDFNKGFCTKIRGRSADGKLNEVAVQKVYFSHSLKIINA
jgi:hypothetical protein